VPVSVGAVAKQVGGGLRDYYCKGCGDYLGPARGYVPHRPEDCIVVMGRMIQRLRADVRWLNMMLLEGPPDDR
jgi:hypothetical protein